MKKLVAAALLAVALSSAAFAGDVPFPAPPPPCKADCGAATVSPIPAAVIQLVLAVLASR